MVAKKSGAPAEVGKVGRPRIWANDAERARAYRARRAVDIAEPERLRAERRKLEQRLCELEQLWDQERREREEAEIKVDCLSRQLELAQGEPNSLADARRRLGAIESRTAGSGNAPTSQRREPDSVPMSRAQRRELERRARKKGR